MPGTRSACYIACAAGVVSDASPLDRIRTLTGHHYSVQDVAAGDHVPLSRNLVDSLNIWFVMTNQLPERAVIHDNAPSEAHPLPAPAARRAA